MAPKKQISKYFLYENAVQTPDVHCEILMNIYRESFGRYARNLREDFCGTFTISTEWVKRNKRNTALGLDLDPEPIEYGMKHHFSKLKPEQKKRLQIRQKNVLTPPAYKPDLIVAANFSFFIFKERKTLLQYFKACLKSMAPEGVLVLETFGGAGAIETVRERKFINLRKNFKYTYFWDQQSFNPISHDGQYAIHFTLPDGTRMRNAFTYDWRIWTIPEIRDLLIEAGFTETAVYWETEHKGEPTGEYAKSELGDNAYSWIAQVVAIKR
ncbi:MAG: class I SAM-dependent methyltransferase [Bdellovibrionia bacterium]